MRAFRAAFANHAVLNTRTDKSLLLPVPKYRTQCYSLQAPLSASYFAGPMAVFGAELTLNEPTLIIRQWPEMAQTV
jgi:hypothetical protein